MTALEKLYERERERLLNEPPTGRHTGETARPVFGVGPVNAELMLIGEAPGANETEQGRPFVGKAGAQLEELLALAGIPRERVFVTNAVKYRPTSVKPKSVSNRTPARAEIDSSIPLVRAEIAIVMPRIIATLGNTPLYSVLSAAGRKTATVGELHGRGMDICIDNVNCVLFPLYHPASGIYRRELVEVMRMDILKLKEAAQAVRRGDEL